MIPVLFWSHIEERRMHMASSSEFVEYIADQLLGAGEITYRKMFGEYGMYCDGKIVALLCQDQLFIKTQIQRPRIKTRWRCYMVCPLESR